MRACACRRCSRTARAPKLEFPARRRRRHERARTDGADRRRRAAAAQVAGAPAGARPGRSSRSSRRRATAARRSSSSRRCSRTSASSTCTCPGCRGIEAARAIGRRAHLVFVTAYDQYAVQAFEQGALDYLVKPVEPARLADTVARLQDAAARRAAGADTEALLEQLAARLLQAAWRASRCAGSAPRSGNDAAPDRGRRHRLPALRREVHAGRLARRRRQGRARRWSARR